MSEYSILVQEYYKNPINNHRMEDADFSYHEGNPVCGDDITVYIKLKDFQKNQNPAIDKWSFDGNVSMITQAAASFFSELVVGKSLEETLNIDEKIMIDNGFEVSPRRRRARSLAILATRNAIHSFLEDGKKDNFDDILM